MSLQLFATVFGVIFVAELPDKTALATLVLATRHRALPVFLGAALALTVQSIVAVIAGSLLEWLPARGVQIGSGVVFVGCAVVMWLRKAEGEAREHEAKEGFWRVLATVFAIVFVAEWGDLTQIATAGFAAKYDAWPTILFASSAALWAVAAIAVFAGNRAGRLLDPKRTQKIAAIVFAIVGVILVVDAL
jgi:Ca2+/H+ antiporter, TMEM165/GDT1 family